MLRNDEVMHETAQPCKPPKDIKPDRVPGRQPSSSTGLPVRLRRPSE